LNDPDTRVYRNDDVGSNALWLETQLTDMIATMVNTTSSTGVLVYGKFQQFVSGSWTIDRLAGGAGGDDDLFPYTTGGSYPPTSTAPGIYDSTNDWFMSQSASGVGGSANDVVFNFPPGASVSEVRVELIGRRNYDQDGNPSSGSTIGDRNCAVYHDDGTTISQLGSGHAFGSGDYANQGLTMQKGPFAPLTEGQIIAHASMDKEPDYGNARINRFKVVGTSLSDYSGTRFSNDNGSTFEGPTSIGLMDLGEGSMTRRIGQRVLATKNAQVRRAPLAGQQFIFDADQGATTSQFAKALMKFGKDDDYLLAPDGGAVGLYKIISNVRTDITPNDGASDGVVVSVGGLAVSPIDNDKAWALMDFGGTVKLAYTINLQGTTTWNFATGFSTSANWVSINPRNDDIVYVADGSTVWRALDGSTFTAYSSPIGTLTGVEPL
jgi:hypothetical protein